MCAGVHNIRRRGIWTVYVEPLKLGRLDKRHMRIEDQYGRLKRHHA